MVPQSNRLESKFILNLNVCNPRRSKDSFRCFEEELRNDGITLGELQRVIGLPIAPEVLGLKRVQDRRQIRDIRKLCC